MLKEKICSNTYFSEIVLHLVVSNVKQSHYSSSEMIIEHETPSIMSEFDLSTEYRVCCAVSKFECLKCFKAQ
jgi:hypothetical protein